MTEFCALSHAESGMTVISSQQLSSFSAQRDFVEQHGHAKSRIRYVRVMGLKEETVREVGFKRLAIFRPGIIAGNAHTPGYVAWLGRLIPLSGFARR